MQLLKRLQNPVALAIQGFILGGIFIWSLPGGSAPAEPRAGSVLSSIETSL